MSDAIRAKIEEEQAKTRLVGMLQRRAQFEKNLYMTVVDLHMLRYQISGDASLDMTAVRQEAEELAQQAIVEYQVSLNQWAEHCMLPLRDALVQAAAAGMALGAAPPVVKAPKVVT